MSDSSGTHHPWFKRCLVGLFVVSVASLTAFVADRALGAIGYPVTTPRQIAHPENFSEHRSNIEFEYLFETNSLGLRYRDLPLSKPENRYRVFVAGDSFVEGTGVDADSTFSSVLERGLGVDFINGGLRGRGPLHYARVFTGIGLRYDLDGLLICVYQNDLTEMPETLETTDFSLNEPPPSGGLLKTSFHTVLPRIYTLLKQARDRLAGDGEDSGEPTDFVSMVSQQARDRGIPEARIDAWASAVPSDLVEAAEQGRFNGVILAFGLLQPHYFTDALDIDTPRAERKWRSMQRSLEEIVATAAQNGIEVGLVYIPAPVQFDPAASAPDNPWLVSGSVVREEWLSGRSELQTRLDGWSRTREVPFLDLTETLRRATLGSSGGGLVFPLDGHWTPAGHRVAADAMQEWMEDDRVFGFLMEPRSRPGG